MKKVLPAVFMLTLLAFSGLSLSACGQAATTNSTSSTQWEGLAKALTEKGVKMYGAYWCSHCQDQKKMFGDASQYITYVECAPDKNDPYKQSQACIANKIESYPTWIFPDGSRVESEMSFDELAQKIGYSPAQ